MYKNTVFNDTIETDFLPAEPLSRPLYLLEMLERRLLMTVVPIDATAGVPFHGLVAVELHLPSYATSPQLINVLINGQWDYTPTAVKQPDGTYDLYASMTPQKAGTSDMQIIFRNSNTGSWDTLETGPETVKDNHFSNLSPDSSVDNQVPGTQYKGVLATFKTTPLTQSLDHYLVEVDWFGKTKTGRLVQQSNGTVAAYVNDGYLPISGDGQSVTVNIRLAGAPSDAPPAGLAVVEMGIRDLGIGAFPASMTSATDVRIDLPSTPPIPNAINGYFTPATMLEGWSSNFDVKVIWSYHGEDVRTTVGTVARATDGTYAVLATRPADIPTDNGMIKITETILRPAVGGDPAEIYTVGYVGSFNFNMQLPDPELPLVPVPTIPFDPTLFNPTITDPAPVDTTTPGLSSSEISAATRTSAPSPFASGQSTKDSLVTDVFNNSDDPLLSRESTDLAALIG